ncbi:MAG TPA: LutB/LldF family L-lactate oxidation iron-sulfur protein [Vicinamibacterales bacterium]|nr:LutB/LldF family L-lactate oxidation iron-sulfur protein [Vicinamibacterales bacterium]
MSGVAMPLTFHGRARAALSDRTLHEALDRATAQLRSRRSTALDSLEHSDYVRDVARRARMTALRNLGALLREFESRLTENGCRVHWADTADDANRIIVRIAAEARVRRIAKSKSMVSEETHLNAALERAGLAVVETDLGEYVTQLAASRPSHIILPIVHMTREQVGRLLQEQLGVPYSDDPQVLAGYARAKLRAEFLRADMGITGANIGVAATGTICLVTNEGNGRMVTTLPRVHVVLMGIEKLVATMADLDAVLKVLARSATGQQLTAYTTLVRGPRRAGDACGPESMHVVLLDNGRTRLLAGESAEILGCIRCGACLNVCPVYRNIGGHAYGDTYPGPVGAVVTPGLRGIGNWAALPDASSLCGACRDICPVRLDIPRMLIAMRQEAVSCTPQPAWLRFGMRAFAWTAARPPMYRIVARLGGAVLRQRARNGWIHRAPGPLGAWTTCRDLRAPARRSFERQWRSRTEARHDRA